MPDIALIIGVFLVAFAYSSVGHGGASGYLALWSFTAFSLQMGATLALILNAIVSACTFVVFKRAKHFDWRLAWPFLLLSIPCAFYGGSISHYSKVQNLLLTIVLACAAIALVYSPNQLDTTPVRPSTSVSVVCGGIIGFVSGLVGVGGGIFLSPVMILSNWARPHTVASISAVFIFANSLAGLSARPPELLIVSFAHWPLLIAGVTGAMIGAWIGAFRTSSQSLRFALAGVLVIAVAKHASKTFGV